MAIKAQLSKFHPAWIAADPPKQVCSPFIVQ